MTAPVYTPLATPDDMTGTPYQQLWRGTSDPTQQMAVMVRASRAVETRTRRRLTPFAGLVQTESAEGIDTSTARYDGPLPLLGALGQSAAAAYGSAEQVRDVWLDQHAALWPELWTYSNVNVALMWPFGGSQTVASGVLEGPYPDTGHLRIPVGTYCPLGTTIKTTYSGGYTLGTPDELREACLLQAAKLLILRMEPQARPGMDTADLEAQIVELLAEYARA